MNQYPRVTDVFLRLSPKYQQVRRSFKHQASTGEPVHQDHVCHTANTVPACLFSLECDAPHVKLGSNCIAAVSARYEAVQVIADITKRMGDGMAKYIQQDVETIADYDEYCHFVAGLVGVGLSQVQQQH